jgi:hypothetical protein
MCRQKLVPETRDVAGFRSIYRGKVSLVGYFLAPVGSENPVFFGLGEVSQPEISYFIWGGVKD